MGQSGFRGKTPGTLSLQSKRRLMSALGFCEIDVAWLKGHSLAQICVVTCEVIR